MFWIFGYGARKAAKAAQRAQIAALEEYAAGKPVFKHTISELMIEKATDNAQRQLVEREYEKARANYQRTKSHAHLVALRAANLKRLKDGELA